MRTERSRRGQAMIEMAIGMLVFVLILGALLDFGAIIPESMRLQSIVRRLAGYEAQCLADGSADGAPLPILDHVLGEPEVRPVTMDGPFSDASMRPLEFRTQALNFAILGLMTKKRRIVTTVTEHNSVLRPLYKLESSGFKICFHTNVSRSSRLMVASSA